MAKLTKRTKAFLDKVDSTKLYSIDEALELLKSMPATKFDQSVDVSVNLGVDPRKSDQVVRGSTVLPNGTGKSVRVAVFAQGPNADAAKEAGADIVGFEDLADDIKKGNMNFDVVIASPDAMRVVGQLGQILGPRGLMPNPKVGTVTPDVAGAVKNAKAGQVRYRTDKAGIIHCAVGKVSFDVASLKTNIDALLADLNKAKPSSAKGVYFKKVSLSSTMGPGITVDKATLNI
ncbi:MAG: 50S ribosomal protein L1 [Gammaproteobacteria bacterium SG8_15]|nr:MAG: 50S ribosomal protein L1 [Gammaproteobacteria bacterium SG8_15]